MLLMGKTTLINWGINVMISDVTAVENTEWNVLGKETLNLPVRIHFLYRLISDMKRQKGAYYQNYYSVW